MNVLVRSVIGLHSPVLTDSQVEILKGVAILLMVINHLGVIFPEHADILSYIGRPVFPLFAFLVAYHYVYHTKNKMGYMLRILVFAFIAQGPYRSAMELMYPDSVMYFLNILFSLSLGLAVLQWIELIRNWPESRSLPMKWLIGFLGFLIFLGASFFVEYMFFGVAMLVAMFIWISEPTEESRNAAIFFTFLLNIVGGVGLAIAGLGALVIIALVMQVQYQIPRLNGILYYTFYPLHFFIFYLIAV